LVCSIGEKNGQFDLIVQKDENSLTPSPETPTVSGTANPLHFYVK